MTPSFWFRFSLAAMLVAGLAVGGLLIYWNQSPEMGFSCVPGSVSVKNPGC